MGNYESSQLAAAIMGSLDQRMVTYVTEQVGAAAGGLKMLRALYMPYYSIPLEDRMAEEVGLLRSRKVIQAKCDVYEAMEAWTRAYRVVSDPAQRPEEKEMREALLARCSGLGISTELEVERVMVERSGQRWTAEKLAGHVKKLAAKWQLLSRPQAAPPKPQPKPQLPNPRPTKQQQVAKVAASSVPCRHWIMGGTCPMQEGQCRFRHDEAMKAKGKEELKEVA